MFRVGSWLYNKAAANASTQSLDALAESQDLEEALKAATLIMNDDVDGAEEGLNKGDSSFHKLGKGIVTFVKATLGLEQDIMRHAASRLAEAESGAYNDQQKAQHNSNALNAYQSTIYSPGTEYLLCQSMAQLMSALVGVLSESLPESIKAFYKLRKAYIALDQISQMEEKYLNQIRSSRNTAGLGSGHSGNVQQKSTPDDISEAHLPRRNSSIGTNPQKFSKSVADLTLGQENEPLSQNTPRTSKNQPENLQGSKSKFQGEADPELFSNPVDSFASRFHSLTGAVAALALLAFYNGFVRCSDILPDSASEDEEDIEGYPMERLENLLSDMRQRFPKSQLWVLEESRMRGANREMDKAIALLFGSNKSPLKQVEALHVFERSIDAMYLHRYELCADSFLECAELNSWSPALYYYIAGASHLELYRRAQHESPESGAEHATKAEELFRKVPSQAGKKKFLARQLPFDVFVTRKIAKWEARAKERKVKFIEAIGVSPIEEMIFFWNGHSRMPDDQLEISLRNLAWSESRESGQAWSSEPLDERAIFALLQASLLRSQRKHGEAKNLLQSEILNHDKSLFKGGHKDDWTCPSAHYEMAANLWMERHAYRPIGHPPARTPTTEKGDNNLTTHEQDNQKVLECKQWLEKVSKWEAYELDARVGLKVTTALQTIIRWESSQSG
ncbi:Mitochondrial outer membrane protein iml2 [Myotisia sp. PD_48]|nr:Mitochondrial outer membrane protein iml2 [Myotisia sp. PD_48]